MGLSWVIAGGGTGGHVTPALALGEVISKRGDRVLFIGSDRGLEARLVPQAGFELVALPSRQVMGRGVAGRAAGALAILAATFRARRELARARAELVVSVGGYAAMPTVIAAATRHTPLALVEPNAIPGRANRLAARFCRRIFVGFEAAAARLASHGGRRSTGRVRCVGIPLREALVAAFEEPSQARRPSPPYHLLVFGGSQGARQINDAVMAALPRLAGLPIEIFHQAGENDRERVAAAYAEAGVPGQVVAFEHDMPARYRWADLALCRAGALTVAELALAGLPSLLVPYPYAADDHQAANARELEQAGAAVRLDGPGETALSGDRLAEALGELLSNPERLVAMRGAASGLARPRAAQDVVEECVRMLEEHSSS
jgi:UDP-N-acetylglucosamine--N-acetylmuramyl-(pentapeptide) pyrophosphoryl-undecaprenol N-acetylglucosamine transferase